MSRLTPEQRTIAARTISDTRRLLWWAARDVPPPRLDPYAVINTACDDLTHRATSLLDSGYDTPARDVARAWGWLRFELTERVSATRRARLGSPS